MTNIFSTNTLKFGILMGLGFCLYSTIMWLTKLDTTYLKYGQYLDMAIIILPLTIILLAIKKANSTDKLKILERIGIAVLVGLISFLIYDPFLYVYHNYVNPTWFESVLNLHKSTLEALNTDPTEIARQLELEKANNDKQAGLYKFAPFMASVIVLPTIIALISLIFVQNKK
jgi:Protein of unknown function (DUF4199)